MLGDIFKVDLESLVQLNKKEVSQIQESLYKRSINKAAYTTDNKNSPAFKFTHIERESATVLD